MILNKKLELFEENINFQFKNKQNLLNAITHPSFIKEKFDNKKIIENCFERLEFLGDRVLGLSISSLLYNNFKKSNEGDLSKKLSYLVRKDFLYKISLEINIDTILKRSNNHDNLILNTSIYSDAVESLIGAIFIDGGYNAAYKFIKRVWGPYLNVEESNLQDPKTHLQEISQQANKSLPKYSLINKEGPPHSPIFTINLEVLNIKPIMAKGKSKREAETKAAIKALKIINE